MTDPSYRVTWTATALAMVAAITDRRIRRVVFERAGGLSQTPEQQGKALTGELSGFRSLRAAGQRYCILYRVERQEVTVLVVAVGRRKQGDTADIYELARKLIRQRLIRPGGRSPNVAYL
jgi:mRNA interferase RelE/StbE